MLILKYKTINLNSSQTANTNNYKDKARLTNIVPERLLWADTVPDINQTPGTICFSPGVFDDLKNRQILKDFNYQKSYYYK